MKTILDGFGDSYTVKSGVKHRARAIGKVKLLVIGGT